MYRPVSGLLSAHHHSVRSTIIAVLGEIERLAGRDHAASIEDDISGPTSGLSLHDALEQVLSEANAVAPAGWTLDLDGDGQPGWSVS